MTAQESLVKARTLLKETNQRWASRAPLLPPDLLEKEQPNARKSVREFAFEGRYTPS